MKTSFQRCQIKMPPASPKALVARSGFEPEHTEPESVVLPLYYQAISRGWQIKSAGRFSGRKIKPFCQLMLLKPAF
jgi:hypothetical protein